MSLETAMVAAAINGDNLTPQIVTSSHYKHWVSVEDFRRCLICENNHGKIWLISEDPEFKPPEHLNCRCVITLLQSIVAGTATINGVDGADWTLLYKQDLPNYYISQGDLEFLGWCRGDKVSKFVEGKMLFGGVYKNRNQHLPQVSGRVWYEADINYKNGRRNKQRILWSNDGLIFVTYDHYKTFYEII